MKQSDKFTIASGIILLSVAAIMIISLMLHFLDFGVALPYFFEKCQNFGAILFSAYGISSFLIPTFFFVASIFLFLPTWNFKRGLYLLVSLIPFFSIVAIEKFCNNIFSGSSSTFLLIKYSTLVFVSALVSVIEYLIVGIIADSIIGKKVARKNQIQGSKQKATIDNLEEENILPPSEDLIEDFEDNSVEKNIDSLSAELKSLSQEASKDIKELNKKLEENQNINYGDLESEFVDIPDSPEELNEFSEDSIIDDSFEEDFADKMPEDDKKRITAEEINALLAPGLDDYPEEPEVIQMDFDTSDKPEMVILSEDTTEEPVDALNQVNEIKEDIAEKKGGLLSTAMKLREETVDSLLTKEDEKPVETSEDIELNPDEEFDRAVFGNDEELKNQFYSEDEQNFLNNPFGGNPNNPFDFLGEAGKDIKIEEDEILEESDEIGAFEFDMDEAPILQEEESLDQTDLELDIEEEVNPIEFDQTSEDDFNGPIEFDMDEDDDLDSEEIQDFDIEEVEESDDFLEEELPAQKPSTSIKKNYNIPTEGVLASYQNNPYWIIDEETKQAGVILKETLSEFKIEAEVTGIRKGPVITMFELLPAPGVKLNKIVALQDNIALRLAAQSVRIVAPIPGKHAVGIEVPNKERAVVSFKELIEKELPQFDKMKIPVVLGKDISGEAQLLDLATTPHLLIAGSTGSGKSVCVNSMILSILYKRSPKEVKMILIDPKIVELKLYNDIPHLLTPVITEPKKAYQALQYCLCEMERRYAMLDHMGVRDISTYNKRIKERHIAQEEMPYIVVIIDEFADLMATTGKELESTVARLAAMSRAVGIHLVLAIQRPSIDVITGLIKANIPTRIAFMVASKTDSRIIIDQGGAEKLLGKGDMLYASAISPFPVRIQGTFVTEDEVEKVVEYVKAYGEPEYIDEEIFVEDEDDETSEPGLFSEGDDPLYDRALEIVIQAGKASASYIQRRLKIGYNRAARLVEDMEARGIVGPANGSKPREIIHIP